MIDVGFDFRSDAGGGDPDRTSPTLRRYHQLLWSKPLPGGAVFDLDTTTPGEYLHHRSELGEFYLSSDSVIPTFLGHLRAQPVLDQLTDEEKEAFLHLGYTIGGMMVFPSNKVDGRMTINAARGFTRSIADRMDLTLECIRRHYRGETSPLAATLARYGDFFAQFEDFPGYVGFFLLQDLVDGEGRVRFFLPFDDFAPPSVPTDLAGYRDYERRTTEFVHARNARIAADAAARGLRDVPPVVQE